MAQTKKSGSESTAATSRSSGPAQLGDGTMWPTSNAVTELSSADEKVIAELVRKAIGD